MILQNELSDNFVASSHRIGWGDRADHSSSSNYQFIYSALIFKNARISKYKFRTLYLLKSNQFLIAFEYFLSSIVWQSLAAHTSHFFLIDETRMINIHMFTLFRLFFILSIISKYWLENVVWLESKITFFLKGTRIKLNCKTFCATFLLLSHRNKLLIVDRMESKCLSSPQWSLFNFSFLSRYTCVNNELLRLLQCSNWKISSSFL